MWFYLRPHYNSPAAVVKGRLPVRKLIPFCLTNDHALLHSDRNYDPFEEFLGLRVIHP